MKRIPIPRLALVAALVVAGVVGTATFGAASAKACGLFSNCTLTVHITGAGQANSTVSTGGQTCVSDETTPTGVEGKTCTYTFGWGWIVGLGAAWPGWDGWQFGKWSGAGFAHPVHCDGEDRSTNTYTYGFCQFQIWQDLEIRAEFVDTQAPDTTLSGPTGYFQRTTSATFTFTSTDHVPSTFKCSLDDAPYTACSSPLTLSGLSQGGHAFRVRAFDPSGNGDPSPPLAQWSVDTVAPQNPALTSPDHAVGYWSTNPAVNIAFSNAQDGWSGVDGYSYVWDQSPTTVPDTVKDAEETATGTTSPVLADGSWYFHLRTVDNAGNWSDPTTVGPFKIDRTPPSSPTVSAPSFPTTTTFTVGWKAIDATSGVASYDVRYRTAYLAGGFGSYFGWKLRTYDPSAPISGIPGMTYCFSGRAWDTAGNVSSWGTERCSAVPLDDGALTASGSWTRTTGTGYYLGTVARSVTTGSALTSPTVAARRVLVLVTKCPTCGSIDVYWNGTLSLSASLAASSTLKRQYVSLPAFSQLQTGVVMIKVRSSAQTVEVDGLEASRT
jgi:hypothetical protein